MSFSFQLLQLPSFVLMFLIVAVLALIGGSGTWLFQKYVRIKTHDSHNEFTGLIYGSVAGLYGLLLAFVVFLVWDQFNGAQKNADIESSLARALYRDIRYYPDSVATKDTRRALISYTRSVVDEEYPLISKQQESPNTVRLFSNVFVEIEKMNSVADYKNLIFSQMFSHLNELATYRNLRLMDSTSEIPLIVWIPLLLGCIVTLLFAMLLDMPNLKLKIIINSLLGGFMGLILFLIIIMDHPFSGEMRIEPRGYMQILKMEGMPD